MMTMIIGAFSNLRMVIIVALDFGEIIYSFNLIK